MTDTPRTDAVIAPDPCWPFEFAESYSKLVDLCRELERGPPFHKDVAFELYMMLAQVTSCLVGLDTSRPEGRVYSRLADEAAAMLKRYGYKVGAAPEWYDATKSA